MDGIQVFRRKTIMFLHLKFTGAGQSKEDTEET